MKKVLSILLSISLMVAVLAGCNNDQSTSGADETTKEATKETTTETKDESKDDKATNAEKSLLEYSVLTVFDEAPSLGHDNPNDVVTPALEDMWKIQVSDVVFSAGMSPIERINMLVAADAVPDVVFVDNPNLTYFMETGAFADISDYMHLLENTDKYVTDAGWNRLKVDGKLVAIPGDMGGGEIDVMHPDLREMIAFDPYYSRPNNWAFAVNEDILQQAGYTFKTIAELQSELDETPRAITAEDVAIEPALKTIEDFETMLYKIQALNLEVDGKPVIPLSIPEWAAYHASVLSAPSGGWYANPETLEVTGYLTNPGMKDFYKYWVNWYQDDLLDPDYIIHKGEQFQEKAASGRVAVMLPAFDVGVVRDNLKSTGSDLKVIPWPEDTVGHSVDASYPGGFKNIMFNKNLSEDELTRLIEYFDWFQTVEAKEILSWGPESAGLYEIIDGERKFTDEAFAEAYLNGEKTEDGRDAEYYGLYGSDNSPNSKAGLTAPGILYNEAAVVRSYPLSIDAYQATWTFVSTEMLNRDGTVLPGAGTASNEVGGYYWGTVKGTKVAPLFSADGDAEFDSIWEELVTDFTTSTDYETAVSEMEEAFKKALGK